MTERSQFDDRPPIDVSRFHPVVGAKLVDADNSLGLLEIAVTHARNAFHEVVASDDEAQKAACISETTNLLGAAARIAESLHVTFAAFNAELSKRHQDD